MKCNFKKLAILNLLMLVFFLELFIWYDGQINVPKRMSITKYSIFTSGLLSLYCAEKNAPSRFFFFFCNKSLLKRNFILNQIDFPK